MFDWGILVLRLGVGIMFLAHGLQMAFGLYGGPGVKGFSGMLSGLGFVPAIFWAIVAAYTVLLGGRPPRAWNRSWCGIILTQG